MGDYSKGQEMITFQIGDTVTYIGYGKTITGKVIKVTNSGKTLILDNKRVVHVESITKKNGEKYEARNNSEADD